MPHNQTFMAESVQLKMYKGHSAQLESYRVLKPPVVAGCKPGLGSHLLTASTGDTLRVKEVQNHFSWKKPSAPLSPTRT